VAAIAVAESIEDPLIVRSAREMFIEVEGFIATRLRETQFEGM
jgi:hypothetical protein